MKIFRVLVVLLLFLLNGCLVHWKYFVHDETEQVRRPPDEEMFLEAGSFVRNGVLVRPDFTSLFDSDNDLSEAAFIFIAQMPSDVFIAELEILDDSFVPLAIPFNKTVKLKEYKEDSRFYFGHIDLGNVSEGLKNQLLKRFKRAFEEGGFAMTVRFKVEKGDWHELLFKMRVEDAKDIAWGT